MFSFQTDKLPHLKADLLDLWNATKIGKSTSSLQKNLRSSQPVKELVSSRNNLASSSS